MSLPVIQESKCLVFWLVDFQKRMFLCSKHEKIEVDTCDYLLQLEFLAVAIAQVFVNIF